MSENTPDPVIGDAPPKANVLLSNALYEKFKKSSLFILPAIGAMYFGLAQIWGLPYGEEVVGTIAVIETFLGVLLGISNKQYNNSEDKYDGQIDVSPSDDEETSNLNVSLDPEAIAGKSEILVKVNKQ